MDTFERVRRPSTDGAAPDADSSEGAPPDDRSASGIDPTRPPASQLDDGGPLVSTAPLEVSAGWRRRLWLHVLLFFASFGSALLSYYGYTHEVGVVDLLLTPFTAPAHLLPALPFAVTLMTILLAHEMGHFLTALSYGVDQSLPFFIPAPTMFGTLGAVILMRSQPANRRVLLKVAVMGPYAGLALALPAAAWGLKHSIPFDPMGPVPAGFMFGDSLLFSWLEAIFSPAGPNVILHPVGMAGWVGLLITSLNLIPAAQLDGGHVAYALFGRHQVKLSLFVVVCLFTLGFAVNFLGVTGHGGETWILWALLLLVIGLRHPPVQDEALPLSFAEKLNGFTALLLFVVTFVPVPLQLAQPGDTLPDEPRLEAAPGEGDLVPVPDDPEKGPEGGSDGHSRGEEFRL